MPVYGSSRLGVHSPGLYLRNEGEVAPEYYTRTMGRREFELTDHLGNVTVTVSDRKVEIDDVFYKPLVTSYTDYYPFGYPMPGRSDAFSEYRYGFNGQEKDNEVYGKGGSYTAEFWQYDSRLGRRWNVDPIGHASISPYATFVNNPVWYSDPFGLDTVYRTKDRTEWSRYPAEGDDFYIDIPGPVDVVSASKYRNPYPKGSLSWEEYNIINPVPVFSRNGNPYRIGSLPWKVYNRNLSNPNLWHRRSTFSWSGSGESQWVRDFNRAFGILLLFGMTGPFAAEAIGAAAVFTIETAPVVASNVSYYSKYALVKSYGAYTAVTSSDLYFMSLGYASKVMAVPAIQFTGGLFIGYMLEPFNILPLDFSTEIPWIDAGIQSGSVLRWYRRKLLENKINEKEISN